MSSRGSERVVGIDLGTTNSAVAIVGDTGKAEIITSAEGNRLVPSVVYFGPDGPIVGEAAKALQEAGDQNIAAFFKRYIGDPGFGLTFGSKLYTAVDLSSLVLSKLKEDAVLFFCGSVDRRREEPSLLIEKVFTRDEALSKLTRCVRIVLEPNSDEKALKDGLSELQEVVRLAHLFVKTL